MVRSGGSKNLRLDCELIWIAKIPLKLLEILSSDYETDRSRPGRQLTLQLSKASETGMKKRMLPFWLSSKGYGLWFRCLNWEYAPLPMWDYFLWVKTSLLQVPQLMKEDPQDLMKGVLNGSYPIPPRIQLSIFPCLNLGLPLGLFMLFFLALDATDLTLLQPMRLPT